METVTLNKEAFAAICALAYEHCIRQGEDTIGGLMKIGGFHYFEVVDVAKQIEDGNLHFSKMWAVKKIELKEKYRKKE